MKICLAIFTWAALAGAGAVLLRADEFISNGVRLHYLVMGKGEAVILIHGLYSSARMNWEMPGLMAELAKHYQVIAFDNRGHGQSDKPTAEDQYGVQMAEDDWPEHVIKDAGHVNCIMKPEFKAQLEAALD